MKKNSSLSGSPVKRFLAKVAAVLPLILFLVISAESTFAAEIPVGKPYVYKQVGGQELKLYVVNPPGWKASDHRPAIVFFHGGGFTAGNPGQFADQCEYLASRGMVAISAQYRLLAKGEKAAPIPANHDAKTAIRWVHAHAQELGIDLDRLASGGGSAGGHLAAFIGLVAGGDDPTDDLRIATKVTALVLLNPAIAVGETAAENESWLKQFGPGGQEFLKFAPAHFVSSAAPPTLIMSGEKDNIVPMAFLKKFQMEMKAAGARCDLVLYPGQGHAFFHRDRANGKYYYETLRETDKFLASLGWLQGPPTLPNPSAEAQGKTVAAK